MNFTTIDCKGLQQDIRLCVHVLLEIKLKFYPLLFSDNLQYLYIWLNVGSTFEISKMWLDHLWNAVWTCVKSLISVEQKSRSDGIQNFLQCQTCDNFFFNLTYIWVQSHRTLCSWYINFQVINVAIPPLSRHDICLQDMHTITMQCVFVWVCMYVYVCVRREREKERERMKRKKKRILHHLRWDCSALHPVQSLCLIHYLLFVKMG